MGALDGRGALMAGTAASMELVHKVEQFLYHEARLLDQKRWDEWLALFTDDGMYWVPLSHGQDDPINHASLFYEDSMLRQMRAKRLQEDRVFSQQPPAYAIHLIGNTVVQPVTGDIDVIVAHSNFHLLEWRKSEQRILGGQQTHELERYEATFRIRLKRVDLVNCDAPQESLQFFL
jgi:benzoate/toluate 1,2-dioxygenase beta subunit